MEPSHKSLYLNNILINPVELQSGKSVFKEIVFSDSASAPENY